MSKKIILLTLAFIVLAFSSCGISKYNNIRDDSAYDSHNFVDNKEQKTVALTDDNENTNQNMIGDAYDITQSSYIDNGIEIIYPQITD